VNGNSSREFCQLRPTFPDKPLIKTYVALWESCSPIVALQLSFLEIFKLSTRKVSSTFLKTRKPNKMGAGRWRHRALASCARASTACHASPFAPSGVRTPRLIRAGPRRPGGLRRPVGHAPCPGEADHAALRHVPCGAVDTVLCRRCDAVGHASWFPTRELTAPGSPHPVPLSLGLRRTEPSCGCLVRSAASP
jgi:hypothetical protein